MFSLRNAISNILKRREMEKKGFLSGRRRSRDSAVGAFAERSKATAVLMMLLVWLTTIVVLIMPGTQNMPKLVERQLAPNTVYSHYNFSYEDPDLTAEARKAVASQVPLYYKIDSEITEHCLSFMNELLSETRKRAAAEAKGAPYVQTPDSKAAETVAKLDKDAFSCLFQIAESQTQSKDFRDRLERSLNEGVVDRADKDSIPWLRQIRIIDTRGRIREGKALKDIPAPQEAASELVEKTLEYYSHPRKPLIKQSLSDMILSILPEGNIVLDKGVTAAKTHEASEAVKPVMVEIRKGQPIVVKEQEITRKDLIALKSYQNEFEQRGAELKIWRKVFESAAISLALMFLTGIYLYHIHPEVVKSNRVIWMLGTITMMALLSNYAFVELFGFIGAFESIPPALVFQAIPLAYATTLLSSLYGLRSALYVGLFISTVAALSLDNSLSLAVTGMMVCGVSGFSVRHASNYRSYFVRSFLAISFTTLVVGLIFLWKDRQAPRVLEWAFILPFVIGFVTAVMSEISLFFFEYVFDVSTNMSLLLLCDYNHPLLKRLQFEAPGTYHHSLVVSTLAEQAAQEIGASSIRARVCALFHDIGKLSQPDYFTENSNADDDKHKELNPRMSSLVILNHVKEGVELARKYKLKRIIRDAIEQHHGTDLVYYFYKRAMEESPDPIGEQEFKYPGPLPRDKEVALVMLADCCEAASRTLHKPSHQKIDALVWDIFRKKIRDGQLDSAELSFRELAIVRKSFVKTLTTMLHSRIVYPKDEDNKDEDDLFMAADKLSQTQIFIVEEPGQKGG